MHVMAGAVILGVGRLFVRDLSDYFCSAGNFENPSTGVGGPMPISLGVVGYTDDSDVNLCCCQGALSLRRAGRNHYIAFKLLAMIRHKVFTALRGLAPAKLEGRDKGNLISIITK